RFSPRQRSSLFARSTARLLHATYLVDRLFMRFDAARSMAVIAFASDEVLTAHNDVAYGRMTPARGLFEWEKDVVRDHFPPPPARVLVGAAGLGRESSALAEMGYSVTAFEPVDHLVASMRATSQSAMPPVRVFQGAYQDMP